RDANLLGWEALPLPWPLINAAWGKTEAGFLAWGCVGQGRAAVCAVGPAGLGRALGGQRSRGVPGAVRERDGSGAGAVRERSRQRCGSRAERYGSGAGAVRERSR
ncbi:unnamed protein product, partial [Coccothraustes coccothraustes]